MNNEEQSSVIYKLNDYFKMPIYYNDKKVELKNNIATDLELIHTLDESCNPIYSFCCRKLWSDPDAEPQSRISPVIAVVSLNICI